jgi:hypothetical protein
MPQKSARQTLQAVCLPFERTTHTRESSLVSRDLQLQKSYIELETNVNTYANKRKNESMFLM